MKTIAVINQKGGVGKTACAYNLAYCFSMQQKTTLLIDLDPSCNATSGFNLPPESTMNSASLILGKENLYNLIKQVYADNIDLWCIPSSIHLALAQRELSTRSFRETLLNNKIEPLRKYWNPAGTTDNMDYIFIDCSPTLGELTINAIYAADLLLIPISYEDDALEGLNDLFKIMTEIKPTVDFRIIRNKKDARKTRTNEYIENKLFNFTKKGLVMNTIIRQDETINQAKIERKPILLHAPHSQGKQDFYNLSEELLNV